MTERKFRVTVRGRFGVLDGGQRAELLARQHDHGMFSARFTPEGVFLYERELVNFQCRYELTSNEPSPADAEVDVAMAAEELTADALLSRGLTGRTLNVALTSMDNIKTRQSAESS